MDYSKLPPIGKITSTALWRPRNYSQVTISIIGSCGFVPCLNTFEQMPDFDYFNGGIDLGQYSPEVGMFYAISPAERHHSYATEAAQALIDYAFQELHLKRIVATTDYDNRGSIGVMKNLGMVVEMNSLTEPPWL